MGMGSFRNRLTGAFGLVLALVAPCARAEFKASVFGSTIENVAKVHGVSYADAAKLLRAEGVTGFDCNYREARIPEYIAAGLQPVNLYGSVDFLGPDGGTAEAEAFVAAAVRYGVPRIMVIPGERKGGAYSAADLDRIVAGLGRIVAVAGEKGIAVMIEDFGGTENVCSHLGYMKEMLDRVPGLRYALDSGNFAHAGRGEDILEMLAYSNRIAHVHLKDSPAGDGRKRVSVGTGAVPNGEIVRTVAARGYDGWYTLEDLIGDDRLPDVRRQVARIRGWIAEGWKSAGGWLADGEPVTLPHTWNAADAADGEDVPDDWRTAGYSSGSTSYLRKAVAYCRALPDPRPGKRYFLRCGGASITATVKVNGREVGRHVGSFTGFCFELTEALKPSGNELEILVDNRFDPDVQPIHADFSVYGGLYRVPELLERDAVCIDPRRNPVVTADPATGHVTVKVPVAGGEDVTQSFDFPDPVLWSPEHPRLYPVTVRVGADERTIHVGFRTVEFRTDGFYLNGTKRRLRGVCRHQDREGKGWGVSAADEAEDVRWMKRMGADAVRTSHYPQSEAFYDLCDREGLLVWTELPNVNGLTFTPEAEENERMMAREMVGQHRNHPCVFAWGIFNELYNKPMSADPEPRMAALRDYVKGLDPTRPVVAASNAPGRRTLNAIPEQLGFNLYPGWYGAAADRMGETIDEAFRLNPGRTAFAVSEYGGGGCVSQHADAKARPARADAPFHPEEYQAYLHWGNYRAIVRDPRVWGSFLWVMFDLGSDARREGARFGLNDKGLVTWDRSTAKDAYFLYKANWNPEPMLHLVGERMTSLTNAAATVMAFSNVGEVELRVNGETVGRKTPDEVRTARWDAVPLRDGDNEIEVRAGNFRRTAHWRRVPPDFPKVGKPRAITRGPKEHLLASYFAIDSWSPDFRYVLALETDLNGRLPRTGERCTLGLVDLGDGNRFIPVTTTACWNFQEAAMAFWMDNDTILFNDLRDGRFRAVVMTWRTKAERVLPMPVSAVSEDRTWAVSLNYARLSLTRPDYGYAGPGQDARETVEWPEDDGLWTMDLATGETKLILSVAQGRRLMPPTRPEAGKPGQPLAYYCHTVISKDGGKIFFLARSVDWFDKVTQEKSMWQTTSFTVNRDGTGLRRCFRDGWAGSHFNWAPDGSHRMLVTAIWDGDRKPGDWWNHAWSLVEFTVGEEEKVRRIGAGILDRDWHCVYSPDGRFMSGETYWNSDFERPWVLVRLEDGAAMPVGSFFVPEAYRGGYWRCDLHARWRPDGRQLGFNSVHEGSRQIYLIDLE